MKEFLKQIKSVPKIKFDSHRALQIHNANAVSAHETDASPVLLCYGYYLSVITCKFCVALTHVFFLYSCSTVLFIFHYFLININLFHYSAHASAVVEITSAKTALPI